MTTPDLNMDDAQLITPAANQDMFEQMVQHFEAAELPYCILAGYDHYPEHIASDVDFMIPASWTGRLPAIIAGIAADTNAHLVQALAHETTATYYVLARLSGASITYLHPDSSSDYRRSGRQWLSAESVLANRRRHPQGFWVPSAADAFAYYLIKKIDKGALNAEQAAELTARYAEDPEGCTERLYALLPPAEAGLIHNAVVRSSTFSEPVWNNIKRNLPQLQQALHMNAPATPWPERVLQALQSVQRIVMRCLQPTGLHIVFLGPDGSGKSSVIAAVSQELAQAFRRTEYRHLRPGRQKATGSQPVIDPHGQPPRGQWGSIAKLLYFWASYAIGSVLWIYPRYLCSTLIIFDRYYQDLLADPARYRYSASLKLASQLGRLLPQPDLVFILDAPAEVLQARKQEVSPEESARQREAYQTLTAEFRRVHVIDAAQPLDQVVGDILAHTLDFLELRTASRLGLSRPVPTPKLCKDPNY